MKQLSIAEFIKEHNRLIRILKTGSKEEQLKEANEQEKELKETVKGKS